MLKRVLLIIAAVLAMLGLVASPASATKRFIVKHPPLSCRVVSVYHGGGINGGVFTTTTYRCSNGSTYSVTVWGGGHIVLPR